MTVKQLGYYFKIETKNKKKCNKELDIDSD